MAPINVTTSSEKVTAAVSEDKVTATVSAASPVSATVTAGFGATGPQGPSGVVNVTAPITNAGTTTAADIGISLGEGLSVSSGSLRVTPGTYATLVGGTVPAAQLPSYVDDVLEFASVGVLPTPGETGKIYVALNTGKIYRWSGSAYFEISTPPDNTDAVPEGSSNLYFTNARARNSFGSGTDGQVLTWSGGQWTAGAAPVTYTLPTASSSVLGGVKIGSGISIDGNGVISASAQYTLPNATTSTLGGVIVGTGLSVSSGTVSANVTSVAGRTGAVTIAAADVSGLGTLATQSGTFSGTSSGTNTGDQTITLTGDVSGSGTGSFAATLASTAVAAGSYGSASSVATFTVDAKGRLTSAGSTAIAISSTAVTGLPTAGTGSSNYCAGNDSRLSDSRSPTGSAGGDLTGTYPNPTIAAGAVTEADLANAVRNQLIHPFLLAGM